MKEAVSIGIKFNFLQRLSINEFIIYSALDWKPFYILIAQSHITPPKFLPNTTFIYEVVKVFFLILILVLCCLCLCLQLCDTDP